MDAGADVDAQTSDGWTPLHVAVYRNHLGCFEILVEAGAKLDIYNDKGDTPMHLASENDDIVYLQTIIDTGANYVGTIKDEGSYEDDNNLV